MVPDGRVVLPLPGGVVARPIPGKVVVVVGQSVAACGEVDLEAEVSTWPSPPADSMVAGEAEFV